ncbi:MAG: plasmid pRiA4b ORF-3 family protein [Candidatus Latescibacteria bacterium]|nr:plasmid pRiA4b ORF-3 family protein [Candidatus Latescibacterota bacterium]
MNKILKLRINILYINPEIWREILVENDIAFEELHNIIQIIFGWTNSHLYNFDLNGTIFSYPNEEFWNEDLDARNKITEYFYSKKQKCIYTYDYGDNWKHNIKIVDIIEKDNIKYPICIAGKRNGPPEDCGGIHGYANIIDVLKNNDKDYDDLLEWVGDYNPEEFDINKVNKALQNLDEYL